MAHTEAPIKQLVLLSPMISLHLLLQIEQKIAVQGATGKKSLPLLDHYLTYLVKEMQPTCSWSCLIAPMPVGMESFT